MFIRLHHFVRYKVSGLLVRVELHVRSVGLPVWLSVCLSISHDRAACDQGDQDVIWGSGLSGPSAYLFCINHLSEFVTSFAKHFNPFQPERFYQI